MDKRIYLSPPHMGGEELSYIQEAFSSNYIAPFGPQILAFEKEFAETVGTNHALAVSSGTAALHLLLRYIGVRKGDVVLCPSFSFVASVNPVRYCDGIPVFIDSDRSSWNMDPSLLASELRIRSANLNLPKAVILVHLYGQPADLDSVTQICAKYQIPLIEDAAESLGAEYKGQAPGTFGLAGFYSFNGNKIITTSGGGMIVSNDEALIDKVRFWSTQARDPAVHYEHSEIGYNYRMSNVLAAIGRGQLRVLEKRVDRKREIFARYHENLATLPGVEFMPEPDNAFSTRWLSCLTINPKAAGIDRNKVINELEKQNIESRPTWKPMHLQPLYKDCQIVGGSVSEELFKNGLCLPSGTNLTENDQARIIKIVKSCW